MQTAKIFKKNVFLLPKENPWLLMQEAVHEFKRVKGLIVENWV